MTAKVQTFDWKEFASNNQLQEKYQVEGRNRFDILQQSTNENQTSNYDSFIQANKTAAETLVPVVKRKNVNFFSDHVDVEQARQQINEITLYISQLQTTTVERRFNQLSRNFIPYTRGLMRTALQIKSPGLNIQATRGNLVKHGLSSMRYLEENVHWLERKKESYPWNE